MRCELIFEYTYIARLVSGLLLGPVCRLLLACIAPRPVGALAPWPACLLMLIRVSTSGLGVLWLLLGAFDSLYMIRYQVRTLNFTEVQFVDITGDLA